MISFEESDPQLVMVCTRVSPERVLLPWLQLTGPSTSVRVEECHLTVGEAPVPSTQ